LNEVDNVLGEVGQSFCEVMCVAFLVGVEKPEMRPVVDDEDGRGQLSAQSVDGCGCAECKCWVQSCPLDVCLGNPTFV